MPGRGTSGRMAGQAEDGMFTKIMVPVDLDAPEIAEKAMAVAKRLAAIDDAEVLVISITADPRDPEKEAALENRLQAYVDAQKGELRMDGVLTLGGTVPAEIRNAAEDMGVDLIVMASHEPRIDDYLFGSRSARVALHTQCSVMVVR